MGERGVRYASLDAPAVIVDMDRLATIMGEIARAAAFAEGSLNSQQAGCRLINVLV